ncbi:MAG: hypothetical protein OEV55_05395 [candidate division Zixibacteria bacterium]|nr:hypothetical protein [candidate division Zixibacteria bacterium]
MFNASLIPLSIFSTVGGWVLSGIGALITLVVAWLAKQYLLPYLSTERKRKMATYILLIADEVTDYFRLKYPKLKWTEWLDQAIDKIIDITGATKEVASRAAQAAIARKVN